VSHQATNVTRIANAPPPTASIATTGSANCSASPAAVAIAQNRATVAIAGCEPLTQPATAAAPRTMASSAYVVPPNFAPIVPPATIASAVAAMLPTRSARVVPMSAIVTSSPQAAPITPATTRPAARPMKSGMPVAAATHAATAIDTRPGAILKRSRLQLVSATRGESTRGPAQIG